MIQDITKEKSSEEELKATRYAAEAANQAKTNFLANISHEIRTPLGAVLGFADLLSSHKISEQERLQLYERIRRNGDQLSSLINDLLDLTKVEANRLELEAIDVDFPELLNDVRETLSIKASEQSVSLAFTVDGEVSSHIMSDPTRIRQILINIINNAIKFTPSGGHVEVIVSQTMVSELAKIAIQVRDTGKGMSQEQMGKLFQPFTQADASTTRNFGGIGLGLFVSQRLARLLQGDLVVEHSELNVGSTFLISFAVPTLDDIKFSNLEIISKEENLRTISKNELKDTKVLVVDDSEDNRELFEIYLSMAGAQITTAKDGIEGIEKALSYDFDIVLMDIQMPNLDGNAAFAELKAKGYKKPIIALSAHAMNEERYRSLNLGFSDYVTKPVKREKLIESVKALTSRKAK